MCKGAGLTRVKSYTTRPFRNTPEDKLSHIFVSSIPQDTSNIVAYTEYNGYQYWVTQDMVDNSDLYIIDTQGIDYFKEHYKGNRPFKIINVFADEEERKERMKKRGDSDDSIRNRIFYDKSAFKSLEFDVRIENYLLPICVKKICQYILEQERNS